MTKSVKKSDENIKKDIEKRAKGHFIEFYNWNLQLSYSMLKLAEINLTLIK